MTAGNGDGGQATVTSLNTPAGIALDAAGNLYFADSGDHVVRRITPAGVISTYAGTGKPGFSGDGGPAVSAQLQSPHGLAFDPAGNLYIADTANARIRRITPQGGISTFAGPGVAQSPIEGIPAASASVSSVRFLAVDATGNVFFTDPNLLSIRRISTTGIVTTFAGGGPSGFNGDGGPATSAGLSDPSAIAFDAAGNLYICDSGARRIRRVAPNQTIATVAGNGQSSFVPGALATATGFATPHNLTIDTEQRIVFSSASFGEPIYRRNADGTLAIIAGGIDSAGNTGDGGLATAAQFAAIRALAFNSTGALQISSGNRIRAINSSGIVSTVAGGYLAEGGPASSTRLVAPSWVAAGPSNSLAVDDGGSRIRRITAGNLSTIAGNGLIPFTTATDPSGAIGAVTAAAYDSAGNLYFAAQHRLFRLSPAGVLTHLAGNGTPGSEGDGLPATSAASVDTVRGIAVDSAGVVHYADYGSGRLRRIAPNGLLGTLVTGDVAGLAIDVANNLYYSRFFGGQVVRVTPPPRQSATVAGSDLSGFAGDGGQATSARLSRPTGLAIDSSGNLYIADSFNNRIRRVTSDGIITTFAGSGDPFPEGADFSGDDGPAPLAGLSNPTGVAVDSDGNVYIADTGNSRLRKVVPGPALSSTTFTSVPAGLRVSVNGVSYITPVSINLPVGSSLALGVPIPQLGPSYTSRYTFGSWSHGGPASQTIAIGATPTTYTANFITQYLLEVAVSDPLHFTANPASADAYYNAGTVVQLKANPVPGFTFRNFSGSFRAFENPITFPMDSYKAFGLQYFCTLSLATPSVALPATAGTYTIAFTPENPQCDPDALVSDPWLSRASGPSAMVFNYTANTGPQRTGVVYVGAERFTFTQAAGGPSATDSGPISGTGATQTLTFKFSHPNGVANLGVVNVLINSALNGANACYLAYSQPAGVLFLVNDAGPDAGLSAPLILGTNASVSNSQCTINGAASSAVAVGNTLTLTLNVTFAPAFGGSRVIYTAARDVPGSGNSGWKTLGNTQLPELNPSFPRTGPMTPTTVATANQAIAVTFQDATAAANIVTGWVLINSAVNAGNACYVAYYAPGNLLLLYPDNGDGSQATAMALTGSNTVENSQCRINAQGSSAVSNGGQITLNLNVTAKGGFAGPKGVWTATQNTAVQTSPWRIAGSWLVP